MRNFKIILQYEGTRYQGWQKQDTTGNTIQGKLEALLTKMAGEEVSVQGSGRTDAGVHARAQVANFHCNTEKTPAQIMEYMNLYLPEDIAVIDICEVEERFHSRLNAKGKTYCYQVVNSAVPHIFERRYAIQIEEKLDVPAMRRAAELLSGTHDYRAFTSLKRSKKSTVRTVDSIRIEESEALPGLSVDRARKLTFTFSGDGFLYHMVRIMMGTLLEVGLHKREAEDIPAVFDEGRRERAGELVPAKGLTLMEVRYLCRKEEK